MRTFADRSALLGALLAGDVDVAPSPGLEADMAATLDRSVGQRSLSALYTQSQALVMLRFGSRVGDARVREAIALAVDRERIGWAVFGGRARIPSSYLVAPQWAAIETTEPPHLDRAAARGLMGAAGFGRGNFGIAQRGTDRLVLTLLVPAGASAMIEAGRGVAADLAILGIAADVSERPPSEIDQRVLRGDFDLALTVESADDPLIATERWQGAVSPWSDVLATAAAAEGRTPEGRALYVELQRLWADAAPALPLYQVLKVDVVTVRSGGIRPASHSAPLTWDIASWKMVSGR
ncbi:MAG: hypothetical protein HYX56_04475 [Chloroflexi bacterium]|nr:hypothetical protein [Chloroflexota bacterium]